MTIRVNRQSLEEYADHANRIFMDMGETLNDMVTAANAIPYKGANAVQFREDCALMVSRFAAAILEDMTAICHAVEANTSAIAMSLGDAEVSVRPPDAQTVLTADDSQEEDGVSHVEVDDLRGYLGVAEADFNSIKAGFTDHEMMLVETDWEGAAKQSAVMAVGEYTTSAHSTVDQAFGDLEAFITAQAGAVETADGAA